MVKTEKTDVKSASPLSKKKRDLIFFLLTIFILILINTLSGYLFHRFDLTSEKRFSLSQATKKQLANLQDIVFVRIYLEGDLPPDYKRLRDATKEMLDEFRAYANGNLEYEFINPSESDDEKTRLDIYRELSKQGLTYNNIRFKEGDKIAEKIIFPGAILSYQGREKPLQLLKSLMGVSEVVMLNNSIQQLEYELSSSIRKLTRIKASNIAFIEGHGELPEVNSADIAQTLSEFYTIERVKIDGKLDALKLFDAAIIAKPTEPFSEKDKFIIDQFIMSGGKVIWLVEHVFASMDSLSSQPTTMSIPKSVNLEDQLFKYGIRINTDLIQDLQSMPIPIVTGFVGNQPKQEFFPWFYFPLVVGQSNHPIVKNVDALKTEFVSSIDTIQVEGVKKHILLTTSPYSKVVRTPTRISLNMLREEPDKRQFNKGPQTVAVLLEGHFSSNFKGRIPQQIATNPNINFKEKSLPTKMIVMSDGDIMHNRFNQKTNQFYELGYDRYTNRVYGNKDFLLNCVNYLLDDSGLIEARTKEFKIRLLDPEKTESQKRKWQIINVAIPIIIIIAFGFFMFFARKKKYA